ncbi:MAG: BlaI/MecI/CopY family transcriptional regulator [Pseudomonadota bacterium]
MTNDVRISEAELDIMAILWADAPLSAVDIAALAPKSRDWSPTTVKTMLARLVDKGAIGAEAQGRRFLYRPLIDRDPVVGAQAGRLVDRLFGGRVSPLVAHLAERRDLTEDDLAELEALIRTLRK